MTTIARKKQSEQHQWRTQQILLASARLMRQKGFQGMTLQDVANELDFTKAALYYYVEDKQDVLFRIFLQALDMAVEMTESILHSQLSPSEKIRAFIDRQVHMIADYPELFTVYFNEKQHLSEEHALAATQRERQIVDAVATIYQEGSANGSFCDLDPMVATFAIMGTVNWVYRWYRPDGPRSLAEISQILQQATLRGLELAH
jgi:AcrR family transcriptional regulator